ncbi:MAG TPA: hypothetical protein PK428_05185, partial [Phycicoccus sp.]|nr:hypothetical protein [Phycicoccus sp.]
IRAGMRHDQALIDHAEADAARQLIDTEANGAPAMPTPLPTVALTGDAVTGGDEPPPIDFDSAFPDYDSEAI